MEKILNKLDLLYNNVKFFLIKNQYLIMIMMGYVEYLSASYEKQNEIDILETKAMSLGLTFNEKKRLENIKKF